MRKYGKITKYTRYTLCKAHFTLCKVHFLHFTFFDHFTLDTPSGLLGRDIPPKKQTVLFIDQQLLSICQEWEKIVNDAGDAGVVLFSLGSVANTSFMPIDMKRAFIKTFSRIPQKIIWRQEGDRSEAQKVPNIHVADWLPQKDLLGNPKVKAFITHGGYNSLTEATYLGVPLLMFPLFADQYANCKRVERLNVGALLTTDNLNEEKVLTALNTVLQSEEIQNNARRLGRVIRGKPDSSDDLAVKWVEFLAEFKNLDQLKPASLELNLIEYFLVDVMFTLLFGFIIFFSFLSNAARFVSRKQYVENKNVKLWKRPIF